LLVRMVVMGMFVRMTVRMIVMGMFVRMTVRENDRENGRDETDFLMSCE